MCKRKNISCTAILLFILIWWKLTEKPTHLINWRALWKKEIKVALNKKRMQTCVTSYAMALKKHLIQYDRPLGQACRWLSHTQQHKVEGHNIFQILFLVQFYTLFIWRSLNLRFGFPSLILSALNCWWGLQSSIGWWQYSIEKKFQWPLHFIINNFIFGFLDI